MNNLKSNHPQQGSNVNKRLTTDSIALAILLAPALAFGQVTPDAGRILESTRPPALIAPPAAGVKMLPDAAPLPAAAQAGDQRVQVNGFVFAGVSAFAEAALRELLAPYAGRALTFAQLNQAAASVTAYYRARGYFLASAYLPAQDLAQGQVRLQVLEGRASNVRIVADASVRLAPALARRYFDAYVVPGAPVNETQLERALLLTQDLPGIGARAELGPGAALGESAIDIALSEGPLFNGNAGFDNSSNRYTGRMRATGGVNVNDLAGSGSQLSLQVASTGSDFNYARVGAVLPVGAAGTRVGLAYSGLRYRLGADFESLHARGTANVAQLLVMHPLLRSRYTSVQLRGGFEDKRFVNRANGVQTSDKQVRVLPLAVSMSSQDQLYGGGLSSALLEVTPGRVDLSGNAASQAADAAGPRSEGSFTRANYQLGRVQRIGGATSLMGSISGQLASKNLEAGEKMSLGGPDRVRAYPAGEASGDEGHVLALEARYELPSWQADVGAFFDYGHIKLNRALYPNALAAGGPGNSYDLKGVGVGINWRAPGNVSVRLQVAGKIGSNPARNASGKDADGSSSRTRAWLQVAAYF
ncbi:ShlB/FhaC/HecB family hemolysin secretion/activation protein [Massilia aquatica]|uniref:ShlB/FhaC/HecB family hemolysin secretion/activation protein n=1 Tax=Massilia aquatica TaxID=2609000 RepID=A0ABX0M4Y0_9BURK|nr:ShlB/FhaC/HecB family hemolysin secretion/activation protein [Massilia aquatica]NHZ42238.1 ShlB/FhaC/HecB family hemolysin secretion/activation protein [Massilia aquatica]